MSYDEAMTAHQTYLKRKYFPELDGLRAISVLLVISVHLYDSNERWRWLAGHRGVTLFFVLSGYLITSLALREEARHGRLSLAAFYVRRCFRIFPLYYFTLGVYCLLILGLGFSAHLRPPLEDALPYYVLYLQEVPFCLWQVLSTRDLVFFQSWTLGAEEKFYLLWPLLAFVLWRGEERRRRVGTAVLAIALAVIPALLTPFGPEPRVVGRMLFCYCSLLTGCLLAFLLHDRLSFVRLRKLGGNAAMTAALLLLLFAHFATPWLTQPSLADGLNVLYTGAVGLFLACLLVGEGPVQRVLRWRPLTAIGRLSYGIYLLHLLALCIVCRLLPKPAGMAESVLVWVLTSLLSIVLAWLLHHSLETFGINLGRRWSRRILERAAQRRQPPIHGEPLMPLYPKLVRNVFFPLSLARAGELAQMRYLREFERTQFLPEEEIRDLQWRRLRILLDRAYAQCPFYRERFDRAGLTPSDLRGLDDLRALPILEKRDIQEQGESMVARDWPRADLIRNQTGGSTGAPVAFYLSKARKCSRAAATLRHNRWAGWQVGDRAAVIWGAPRDRPLDTWRARLRGALLREPLWLDTGNVTERSLAEFHTTLLRWRPRVIQAYARSAVLFAQYLQARGLTPHRPHGIVTSAEVLETDERRLLEDVFGCPVFNRYGCREVSVIASECPAQRGLHIMAEGLYLEIETPHGPAVPGEMGTILVTDLLNHAMPLIRYRIGDLGAWANGSCPCGRGLQRLKRIAGRVTDFLVGVDDRLVSGVFLATYVVAQRPSLGQVQILQHEAGAVTYRIKPGRDFHRQHDLEYLCTTTRQYLGAAAVIDSEVVEELPAEPSGKFLFSRSTVAPRFVTMT